MLIGEVLGFCVFVLAYGYVIARFVPKRWYVLTNILTAAGSLLYARLVGASWENLGLSAHYLIRGTLVGIVISIPIIIGIVAVAAIPLFRNLFSDGPSKHKSSRMTVFELLLRIPFGTALSEEVIFRSVLLGLLLSTYSTLWAVALSSMLFGIWHIIPTLNTLSSNDSFSELIDEQRHRRIGYLLLTIVVTMVAGAGLSWLRMWTDSVITPWVVHTCINSVAVLSGFLVIKINGSK